jgi:hypothetical protein
MARLSLALFALALASCEPSRPAEPALGQRVLKGPKKLGSSITHTQMCTCQACDPGDCCAGDWGEPHQNDAVCKDSYEFSDACGIKVSSCSARCFQHVWRVPLEQSCDATTPLVCCGG